MCGISFLFDPSRPVGDLARCMNQSLARMAHRGPDDHGIWHSGNVFLGHRRLSIIDLSASRQPMVDPAGRYVLSFNGEIYNYEELRRALEGDWAFCSSGDTEVLLAGLAVEGVRFIERMEGMWAFALWDEHEQQLLLCRDRMGKKPLYFQVGKESFFCSSELPSLSCLSDHPWHEDLDSTADYLRYGYYLPGTTAYREVSEVLPGHYLEWRRGQSFRQQPFWSMPLTVWQETKQEAACRLRQLFIQAVRKRLVADVEVGAFLSGGVDSSLVVSIMTRELGVRVKTFTIGFRESSYDESPFAQQVAEHCSTDHHVELLEDWGRQQLIDLVLNNIGQPFADSSLLPTTLVSKVAAGHVKVALSGDGGDELFSGYQRYQARAILRWYTRLPRLLRQGAGRLIRKLPEPMQHHSRSILKKAHLFQDIIDRMQWENPYVAPVLYSKQMFCRLFPDLEGKGHRPPGLPEQCQPDDIQQMMIADALIYLPQDILVKVDRASMACSLETRAPFLDSEVIGLAFSLPRSWHRHGLTGKRMLRYSFQNLLPSSIWQRRKQGFGVPIHKWFRKELGTELEELLLTTDSPVNGGAVRELLLQHRQGQRDHGYRLWSIYIYLLWQKIDACS